MGTENIAPFGSVVTTEMVAGQWTEIAEIGGSERTTLYVDVSGAATLTVEFSDTGAFAGEEISVTASYSSATEEYEQFGAYPTFVRAKVDQNLNTLEVGGAGAVAETNVRRWTRGVSKPESVEAETVDTDSANVTNDVTAGSVDTDSANVTNNVTAGSVDTAEINGGITNDQTVSRIYGERIDSRIGATANVNLDFTGLTDYSTYILEINDMSGSSSGYDPTIQFSSDGGSSFISSGYEWVLKHVDVSGTESVFNSQSDSAVRLFRDMATSDIKGQLTVTVKNMGESSATMVYISGTGGSTQNTGTVVVSGAGALDSTTVVDSLRISQDGSKGNSQDVRLYGVMD
jgi:hypothetical protein